jgi:hypothetical protein
MPEKSDNAHGSSVPEDARSVGEKVRDQLRGPAGDEKKTIGGGDDGARGEAGTADDPAPVKEGQEAAAKPVVTSDDIINGPGDVNTGHNEQPEEAVKDDAAQESGKKAPAAQPAAPDMELKADAITDIPGSVTTWDTEAAAPADDELTRRLEDAGADDEIRRRLESAHAWEEKQEAEKREKELQREEIEKEYEQRQKEERRGKWKRNTMIAGAIIVVILVAAVLSFSVTMNLPSSAETFPFISTYDVRMPQGTPVEFANIPVTVSGTGEKVIVSISGGLGTELNVGDQITFSEPRRVNIRILGITLLETDYQVVAEFRGYIPQTQQNDFYVAVMTSQPIPGWAVGAILPDNVEAYPVNADIV